MSAGAAAATPAQPDVCADPALLSIADAQRRAMALIPAPVPAERLPLGALRGRVLAEDVASAGPLPPFDHSAMDGYALADLSGAYQIRGRLAAGSAEPRETLRPGEAVRIMTGAPIPPGAVAVVMQERAERREDRLTLREPPEAGANIRRRGEDVAPGEVIAPAGVELDARHVAILAACGVASVSVRRRVRIALISTGDELLREGEAPGDGRINDANRPMLAAALDRPAYEVFDLGVAPDEPERLRDLLVEASRSCDAIVTSGATSVGEEDHLAPAVAAAGGVIEIAKVSLKPGKPVVAGRIGQAALIGLPGNPFAALVAHLLIGSVMLKRLAGLDFAPFQPLSAVAAFSAKGPGGRTEFAPAALAGVDPSGLPMVAKLGRGGSARLKPLIAADGLVVIPANREAVSPGDRVGFLPFSAAFEL